MWALLAELEARLGAGMDGRSKERLRSLEEALGAQIAELRADTSDKDLERAAKAGR